MGTKVSDFIDAIEGRKTVVMDDTEGLFIDKDAVQRALSGKMSALLAGNSEQAEDPNLRALFEDAIKSV